MKSFLYSLILLAALSPIYLSAQENAEKVSDFNYGDNGRTQITSLDTAGGALFGNVYRYYGQHGDGLLSGINPTTGEATALLDTEATYFRNGRLNPTTPSVFELNGVRFGIQFDLSSGLNLYRLGDSAGDSEILYSTAGSVITKPVIFRGQLYFLAGNFPFRLSAGDTGNNLMELWKTDGTPEGTVRVTEVLSFVDNGPVLLIPGTDRLLIVANEFDTQTFWLYTEGDDGPLLVSEGFNQFTLDATFRPVSRPAVYRDGNFYLSGGRDGASAAMYQVDETDRNVTQLDFVDQNGLPYTPTIEYVTIEYYQTSTELLAVANSRTSASIDLYRIDAATATATLINSTGATGFSGDNRFNAIARGNTLYYLGRDEENDLSVRAYQSDDQTVALVATFDQPLAFGQKFLTLSGNYLYYEEEFGSLIRRIDLMTGTIEAASARVSGRSLSVDDLIGGLTAYNDGVYWVDTDVAGSALRYWNNTAAEPVSIGNYATRGNGSAQPFMLESGVVDHTVIISADGFLELAEGDPAPTPIDQPAEAISIRPVVDDGENAVYAVRFGNGIPDQFFIRRGSQDLAPIDININTIANPEANDIEPLTRIPFFPPPNTKGSNFINLNIDGGLDRESFLVQVIADSLQFTQLSNGDQLAQVYDNDSTFVTRSPAGGEYVVYDLVGTELYRFTANPAAAVRYADSAGAWTETINEDDFTPTLRFHPADGSATRSMEYIDAVNARGNREAFRINDKLLFVGAVINAGNEWLVADPASGTVTMIKDVNPGNAPGPIFNRAIAAFEDGIVFQANDGTNGNELWFTDGTAANTNMIADLNPGAGSFSVGDFINLDGTIFFSGNGPNGYEVYRMGENDRTPELVIDLFEGEGSSHPYDFVVQGDDLLFFARESANATRELYRISFALVPTDAPATRQAAKIYPNPVGQAPLTIEAPAGEQLNRVELFDQTGRRVLTRSYGDAEGTSRLRLDELPAGAYWLRTWYASGRFGINAVQVTR